MMLITQILITSEKNIHFSLLGAVITVTSQHNHCIIPTLNEKVRDKTLTLTRKGKDKTLTLTGKGKNIAKILTG